MEQLQLLQAEIAHIARDYRLEASTEDLRSVIMAEFGLLWSDLEELRPARLSDYGVMSIAAAQALAPHRSLSCGARELKPRTCNVQQM